jgi:hypothetical protein
MSLTTSAGPAAHNSLIGNTTNLNPGGCGIALADHTGKGIYGNLVARNVSDGNGLGTPSAEDASSGSGVILAGSVGGVYDNTITANTFDGNGHAGFDVHAHAPGLNSPAMLSSGTGSASTTSAPPKATRWPRAFSSATPAR